MALLKKQIPKKNKTVSRPNPQAKRNRLFKRRPKCIMKIIQQYKKRPEYKEWLLKHKQKSGRLANKSVKSKVKAQPNMEISPKNSLDQKVQQFISMLKEKAEPPVKYLFNRQPVVMVSSMKATDKLLRKTITGPLGDMPVRQKPKGAVSQKVKPSCTKQQKKRANSLKQPTQTKSKSIKKNVSTTAERSTNRKPNRCSKCGVLFFANENRKRRELMNPLLRMELD